MSNGNFVELVTRLTTQDFPIGDLVDASARLRSAGEEEHAALIYQLWIKCNPQHPLLYVALFNLSALLTDRNDLAGAKAALEQAISTAPDFHPAHINLGGLLERIGAVDAAVNQWSIITSQLASVTASAINYKATALKQIGRVLESNQKLGPAEIALREGLSLDPSQTDVAEHYLSLRMVQCYWPVVEPWEGVSRTDLMKGWSPLSLAAYADDPIFQLATAWQYNRNIGDPPGDIDYVWKKQPAREPGRRLRIGYLSSDLREHAIGFLMAEMFELHDRDKVEVFAYYCGVPAADGMNARIRAAVEHWIDLTGLNDPSAADRIAADGIDILVDVNGYTRFARSKVLAYRPAPIIVNWLGFPGTMASPYHHYIIADECIIPPEAELYYSEKVMRLPCYQPNDRKRIVAAERPTRQDAGLPEDAVVYCCFNSTHKITRFTLERWMRILAEVPNSVLWLMGCGDAVNERLQAFAAARGIAPDRLIFAPKLSNPQHLARYPLADLFLDTAPYGAHTTASDALWMGVPVITLTGRTFAARVCSSLVRSATLHDLVCASPDDYVEKAIALGRDPAALRALRDQLAANRDRCALFDMDRHTRSLESLYRQMWDEFERGELPQPDLANMEVYREVAIETNPEAQEMITIADYLGFYREKLARRHKFRPIPADRRLWTAETIKALKPAPAPIKLL